MAADGIEALVARLHAKKYTREAWDEPHGTYDQPCDADDYGAEERLVNPDGPEAASALTSLKAERDRLEKHSADRAQDIITLGQQVGTLTRERDEARAEVERLRELFRADGEQHAQFVKNLTKAHEDRITKYADAFKEMRAEVDGWRDATMEAREGCRQRSEVISSLRRHLDAAEAEVKRKDVALRLAYGTLAQAFGRIHGLPRTSDTDLANAIGQTRAKIEAALRAHITALEEEGKP